MLKQRDIPAEDQAEVFRIADTLYREDEEHRRNADSSAAASAELGVPQEYLDRAAQELHLQRLDAIQRKRKRTWIALAVGLAIIGGLGLVVILSGPRQSNSGPAAMMRESLVTNVYDLTEATVRANPESKGTISSTQSASTIQIDQFVADSNGDFYGNIILPAGNVRELVSISAQCAANGIANVRLDLEAGNVRWKGPVSSANTTVSISAKEFQRQVRQGAKWKDSTWSPPSGDLKIAFKTGKTINDVTTRGTLTVTNVELKSKQ